MGRLMKNLDMLYRPAVSASGFGFTTAPSATLDVPSETTRSPGFRPLMMIHISPERSAASTVRMPTLLSGPTTAT